MVSREKQLKRLKKDALRLWVDQQELLTRANGVGRDALPHAQYLVKEKLGPAASTLYAERVLPTVGRGTAASLAAGRFAVGTAQQAVFGTIVPAISSASAAALVLADEAGRRLGVSGDGVSTSVKKAAAAVSQITKRGHESEAAATVRLKGSAKAAKAAGKVARSASDKGGIGVGGTIGIVLAALAAVGIGYAVWQTLRADDDLWVADDEPDTTATGTDTPTI